MSDLTIALAVVGGVALAAVVAHGAWQARRAGPRRAAPSPEAAAPTQIEPVLTEVGAAADVADALPLRTAPRRAAPRLALVCFNGQTAAELYRRRVLPGLPESRS